MSYRYVQAGSVAVLLASASMPVRPAHAQQQVPSAPPAAAAAAPAPAPAGTGMNFIGLPKPEKGKLYRFSLCTGEMLDPATVSRPCYPAEAKGVTGATPNHLIEFHLQNGSFLPPGFTLDGNGVITGAANAALSKLKAVNICPIQQGGMDSNYLCKGQTVDFKGFKVKPPPPAAVVKSGGGSGVGTALKVALGVGGAATAGIFLKSALDDLNALDAANTSTTTTTTPSSSTANWVYANWNCNNGPQCITVLAHNTGSTGPFCSATGCNAWRAAFSSGATCTSTPQFTVYGGPSSGCKTGP